MRDSQDGVSRTEIDAHVVTAERDDVLHIVIRGFLSGQATEQLRRLIRDYGKDHPAYSAILIVNELTGIENSTRRNFVEPTRRYPFAHLYIVGASFAIRTIIGGMLRAKRLLQPNSITWSTDMVATEQEARQMISARARAKQAVDLKPQR